MTPIGCLHPPSAACRSGHSVVADSFEKDVTYPEPKVNAICGGWLDDWVSPRRALIDEGLLRRDAAAQYERV
ncbi:DUF2087 domain-containing protein [Streptomyces sp. NRRL WC-3618]|uniref:DUF2087 domain-containing protein n=1 Tax=Streptomyces sp. NRRL WC-3618 TaxID=1519490 RepID=UPI00227723A7|nr:DUF2087 domain-containing protein [Streptomyces sp. NRRL WC-3618]